MPMGWGTECNVPGAAAVGWKWLWCQQMQTKRSDRVGEEKDVGRR